MMKVLIHTHHLVGEGERKGEGEGREGGGEREGRE
jgi:hypothetical protein